MNKALKIFAFLLIAVAVIIGCAVVYFSYQNSVMESEKEVIEIQEIPAIFNEVDEMVEEEVVEEKVEEEEVTVDPAECATFQERVDDTAGEIEVDWIKEWATTSPEVIFNNKTLKKLHSCCKDSYCIDLSGENVYRRVYEKGVITSGPYVGSKIYYVVLGAEGPAYSVEFGRVIKTQDNLIYLGKYSSGLSYGMQDYFTVNNSITISDLDLPDEINIPNKNFSLIAKNDKLPYEIITEETDFLFSQDNFSVKRYKGCFFAEVADGSRKRYLLDVDFFNNKGNRDYSTSGELSLDLDDFNNKDSYTNVELGCGMYSSCYNYIPKNTDIKMKKIGVDDNGLEYYQGTFDLKGMYDIYYAGYQREKVPYEEFMADYPALYWQDPFGGYIRFEKIKYQSGAECGKPVIYLYPEQEQDISVWVEPNGGFTVTEPVYDNGWRVRADKESNIYNYADGEVYPYLFWEGHAYNYRMGDKGFVVAREDVREFLVDSLTKLGLIKKEYDEFIEFWLPKMQEKNYYFISFMPQAEFEQLAPLTVSPKPDTVIRVFMDYQGLDNEISVAPQELLAPERNGFTVVEWGGALHR